jgi:hypothetical protein
MPTVDSTPYWPFRPLRLTLGCLLLLGAAAAAGAQDPPAPPWPDSVDQDAGLAPSEAYEPADVDSAACCEGGYCCNCPRCCCREAWRLHVLPDGLIYRSYLAGVKEPRLSSVWFHDKNQGWLHDATLGGRVGLLRYGNSRSDWPEGWQWDVEGAAFPRVDPEEEWDLNAADFRAGTALTYGEGPYQTKFAYYHLSSHIGDEFLIKNPTFQRINYVRDAFVWSHSYYWTSDLRLYFELEYAFNTDGGAEPLAFQFGADFSPAYPTGLRGAPFAAVNAYLREDFDFGGNFVAQAGWQWRGGCTNKLLRIGLHYYTGVSSQWEFFDRYEEQIGAGVWYDY